MIRYIQFNKTFDAAKLQQEVGALEAGYWKDHYNKNNYEGSWSTLQLRSINGIIGNNTAIVSTGLEAASQFADTELMDLCPYTRSVIGFFEMEKSSIRFMKLESGAVIKPHSDPDLNYEEGEVRIHIPVITNEQLYFYLEDERIVMEEGSCWYMNLSLQHSVRNEGATPRIHLVIDGIVNNWLKTWMDSREHTRVEMQPPAPKTYSASEQQLIIAQLRSMNTETSNRLADEMEHVGKDE